MKNVIEGEWIYLDALCIVITIIVLLCAFVFFPHAMAYNISVGDIGTSYIRWDVANNTTPIWLDGVSTPVYGQYYYQHDLSAGSKHIGCIENETCIEATTQIDGFSVFNMWIVYLILIGFIIVSYYFPITYVPAVLYSVYLILVYLPDINADFNYYILTGILMIMNIITGAKGVRKGL